MAKRGFQGERHYAGKPRAEREAEALFANKRPKPPPPPKPIKLRDAKAKDRPVRVRPPGGRIRMQRGGNPPNG